MTDGCERCPSTLAGSTGIHADEIGYEFLCTDCLADLVPKRWPENKVIA